MLPPIRHRFMSIFPIHLSSLDLKTFDNIVEVYYKMNILSSKRKEIEAKILLTYKIGKQGVM